MAKKSQGDAQSDPLPPKNREVACAEGALYFAARSGSQRFAAVGATLVGFAISKGVACAGGALYLIARSGTEPFAAATNAPFQLSNFNLISKVFQDGRRGSGPVGKSWKIGRKILKLVSGVRQPAAGSPE